MLVGFSYRTEREDVLAEVLAGLNGAEYESYRQLLQRIADTVGPYFVDHTRKLTRGALATTFMMADQPVLVEVLIGPPPRVA